MGCPPAPPARRTDTFFKSDNNTLRQILAEGKKSVKEGGGLAAYLRNGLPHIVREDLSFDNEVLEKFDGLFIELSSLKTVIGVIYRTPRFNSITEFTSHLIKKD